MQQNAQATDSDKTVGHHSAMTTEGACSVMGTVAIRKSLRGIVLPALLTTCAATAITGSQLNAYAVANGLEHPAVIASLPPVDRQLAARLTHTVEGRPAKARDRQSIKGQRPDKVADAKAKIISIALDENARIRVLPQGLHAPRTADATRDFNAGGVPTAAVKVTETPWTTSQGGFENSVHSSAESGMSTINSTLAAASPAAMGTMHPPALGLVAEVSAPLSAQGHASREPLSVVQQMLPIPHMTPPPPSIDDAATLASQPIALPPGFGAVAGYVALPVSKPKNTAEPDSGARSESVVGTSESAEPQPIAPTAFRPVAYDAHQPGAEKLEVLSSRIRQEPATNVSASAAVIEQNGITLVKVGALVELLRDHFNAGELKHLRSSTANSRYVPTDALERFGIPVSYDRDADTLRLDALFMQASVGQEAGAATGEMGVTGTGSENLLATASVGFDTNPFLASGDSPEAVSARLQLNPSITRSNARSSIRASGRVEHIEYLGNYRSLQNYGADLTGRHRLNERTELNLGALFRSDILGTDLTSPLSNGVEFEPGVPVIPGGNDVTILGQRQRRTQYGADAGATFTPSERDEVRLATAWRSDRFGSAGLSDSDFFSQQLRYSRQINADLAIGAVVDASIINFGTTRFGDAETLTPQALIVFSLSERLKVTSSAGVAFTRIETPSGKETTRAFAGNLSLCYQGELSNLCLNGSRQVLPSAIGGARVQTTAGLSYSLRLSERDRLEVGGNYSRASQPLATVGGRFESFNVFTRYERDLSERSRLFVSGGYLDTSGNNAINASNFQAVLGVTINLGRGQ